ncbi:LPS export ABC transporter permease LptF [Methylotuvimicrobium sp.]|uniref:LPS export ABC transporter permease LptF n=1 Tax=Methylotuvimicrobium sp. TaxID=2822413 RepID=UPI003D662226
MNTDWNNGYKSRHRPLITVLDSMIVADLTRTLTAVLSVIVVIIVSRRFIRILEKAIEGAISNKTLLNILGLKMIEASIAFLPAAFFMAVLMVVGRMYRDQEMSAMFSAGGGAGSIYRSVFIMAFPLAVIATGLSFYVGPWAETVTKEMMAEDEKSADIRGIAAGRFSEYQHGDLVFYVEQIDDDDIMQQVFVQHRKGGQTAIIGAETGRFEDLEGGLYLILEQGRRVLGKPGEANYTIEEFAEYAVRLEERNRAVVLNLEAMPTKELWKNKAPSELAELHRRLSIPTGLVFLALLAVPLAQISPRGGVYGNMFVAFLIYFSYGNLTRINHSWLVKEKIPLWFGGIWVDLVLSILAVALLVRLYSWRYVLIKIQEKVKL